VENLTLQAARGNDTYFVDDLGDAAFEGAGQGNDTVFTTANYGLAANVENLVMQGGADLQGYGNNQANVIYGNAGNNLLNGAGGVDLMVGGAGNDTYFVDDPSDSCFEVAGQGNDAVLASRNYGLAADVETLVMQGNADLQGYGSNQASTLYGQRRQQPHQRRRRRRHHDRRASATTPISLTMSATWWSRTPAR
jgi:Ca2+-binding RTX toxin-like protein